MLCVGYFPYGLLFASFWWHCNMVNFHPLLHFLVPISCRPGYAIKNHSYKEAWRAGQVRLIMILNYRWFPKNTLIGTQPETGFNRLFQKVKRRKMRKVKSYCKDCFTPKKMEFRRKVSFVAHASDQPATFIGAPTKIETEQNKLAQVVTNRPVKKPSKIWCFSTLQTTQKRQAFTLH